MSSARLACTRRRSGGALRSGSTTLGRVPERWLGTTEQHVRKADQDLRRRLEPSPIWQSIERRLLDEQKIYALARFVAPHFASSAISVAPDLLPTRS